MNRLSLHCITLPIPTLKHTVSVLSDGENITSVCFDLSGEYLPPDDLCLIAAREFSEYFSGTRREFDLPLKYHGSEFFIKLLNTLQTIPYGKTATYSELALMAGSRAVRATGSALKRNPLPILIPCHRIVPATGGYGNYGGGEFNDIKIFLMDLEKGRVK